MGRELFIFFKMEAMKITAGNFPENKQLTQVLPVVQTNFGSL